jgi:hypothetical protein
VPAQKDITPLQTILRSTYIDKKYMDRLKGDPPSCYQQAAELHRGTSIRHPSQHPRTQPKVLGVRIKMKNPENDPVGVGTKMYSWTGPRARVFRISVYSEARLLVLHFEFASTIVLVL